MINTSVHYTPILHSPLGESPAAKTLSESNNVPLKPVEPATATERARLRTPRREVELEENRPDRDSSVEEGTQEKARENRRERERLEQDRAEIIELAARDRDVRAHEQAHVAVGGQYAGGARYQYERGPDGVNYAVSGEVSIDVSKAATPEATIAKAQTVRRAALAPAEPSPQDLRVAAQATLLENEARKELAMERVQEARENNEARAPGDEKPEADTAAKTGSRSSEDQSRDESPARSSTDNAGFSGLPVINSRLASGIDNTRFTASRVGNFLDQLA